LLEVIPALPQDCPGIVITQHMPPKFTTSFAARLDKAAQVRVVEAKDGMRILPGHAYVAEGDFHLSITRSGANYILKSAHAETVNGHRPSVDVLFQSVAQHAASNAIGVILTGMGSDGAKGLLSMRQAGAHTIGQEESSCVIYGMPRAAKLIGAVIEEKPLGRIAEAIAAACGSAKDRAIRV
jgi:two-component system, chemotaxis family, protein-glutamate methylesterase/glutaminase